MEKKTEVTKIEIKTIFFGRHLLQEECELPVSISLSLIDTRRCSVADTNINIPISNI